MVQGDGEIAGWRLLFLAGMAGAALFPPAWAGYATTFANFKSGGLQVTRFDTAGDAVDAHDGEIALFEGLYYLYGTSYDCGYQWGVPGTRFCGFKAYSSPDLVHWTDRGFLFDASTAAWQTRCDGASYGCYRPHVIYHAASQRYVLWVNVYDNSVGFRVFTSTGPAGPFLERSVPSLAVNNDAPAGGVNNGDHDTFVDDDGIAYLAYTDWRAGGGIVIERLSADYLSGSGVHVKAVTPAATEAPALFRRGAAYYLTYSDPNCGYCATGTSYRRAASPLGPWSSGTKISANSCGGQPAFVTPIGLAAGTAYMYGSDLWNNRAKNEGLANYFWAPLGFAADGSILPLVCQDTVKLELAVGSAGSQQAPPVHLDNASGVAGFTSFCDIGGAIRRSQTFVASRTGTLVEVAFTTFQSGGPEAGLFIEIHAADASHRPAGPALSSQLVSPSAIGWSARQIKVATGIPVQAGVRYALVARSPAAAGCYGLEYNDAAPLPGGGAAYSSNGGLSFAAEPGRTLKFHTVIRPPVSLGAGAPARIKKGVVPDADAKGSRKPGRSIRFRLPGHS